MIVTLAVLATGLSATGALALGARLRVHRRSPSRAIAAVAAQLTESARAANGLAVAVLGAAFALRAIGDAGPHWLSWLSPLGWGQSLRAFAGERWWVLLLLAALAVASTATAVRLKAGRDLGAGHRPAAPRPARAAARARRCSSPGACSAARSPAGPPASRSSAPRSAASRRTSAT